MARIVPTAGSTREDWERVIGINVRGVWSCMKHELRQMAQQDSGAIVNNASVGADRQFRHRFLYHFQAWRGRSDADGCT